MKNFAYWLLKLWIKAGLYLYYGKIVISGLENVPENGPVLFLPNHQGALIDVLLIVTDCRRKPFFLTRSDVFRHKALNDFFAFLQMLPIYRIRDGRESLKKNRAVFDTCIQLFRESRALVMFPEANHNRKRRVRPLSKGFTRIVLNTLQEIPKSDLHIVPIGMNYRNVTHFPDKVAVNYGRAISVRQTIKNEGDRNLANTLKGTVFNSLKKLTTHIADEDSYDTIIKGLDAQRANYLNPTETNAIIRKVGQIKGKRPARSSPQFTALIFRGIFTVLNFPVLVVWRTLIKPKVWEAEFTATLRFGFALVGYPIYYLALFALVTLIWNGAVGLAAVVALFLCNFAYTRWS